jgi:ubiquinone/menaquinone biosynthesis C-methylase UbiE
MRILNVGCGNDTYGTDFVDLYPSRADVIKCDLNKEKLPFRNRKFDKVYSKCVLEHLINPGFALGEMVRVLKKGGILELVTDNASYIGYHLSIFGSNLHIGGYKGFGRKDKHYALYTAEHLKNFLENFRLKIIKIEYIDSDCKLLVKLIRIFLSLLSKRIAYPRIRVLACKV